MADIRCLGQAFKEAREARGLAEDEIDQRAKLAKGYVAALENGDQDPTFDTMQKVAQAIGVPLSRIAFRAEELEALAEER